MKGSKRLWGKTMHLFSKNGDRKRVATFSSKGTLDFTGYFCRIEMGVSWWSRTGLLEPTVCSKILSHECTFMPYWSQVLGLILSNESKQKWCVVNPRGGFNKYVLCFLLFLSAITITGIPDYAFLSALVIDQGLCWPWSKDTVIF